MTHTKMNEVEKLYENAGLHKCTNIGNFCKHIGATCERCKKHKYPPFTAEKQLNIVKFLLNKSVYYDTYGDREYWFHLSDEIENSKYREFDEAIAECINKMWEDLRDYEKVQIKEILE